MELTFLDWTIIVTYFVVALGIGLAFSRRAGKDLTEYFVSGRSLPWWIAGTSMVATTFAADTPLAVTGLVALNGLAGNWFWWAFALGGMFTVFVYARLWRRAEVLTDVEFLELRYAGKPAAALRGIRAVYIATIVNPIIIGWVTVAMVTVLKETVLYQAEPEATLSDWSIITICLIVVGIYASLSGLWGVAITDFIQFFVAMIGCVILAVVAVRYVGGIDALETKVADSFGGGDQAFRFLPDFSAADPWMPLHIFLIFLLVQWWATWYPGAEPGGGGYIVQRMASCKDERHALLATLWYQIAHYCLRPWPWLLVSFVALALFPELRQYALDNAAGLDAPKPDVGFARVIRVVSPAGLRGLMLVTFFAAFMSTISTQMNWGASYLMRDVYQRFYARQASDRHLANASRVMSVLVLCQGGVAAYLMKDISVDRAWALLAALGAGTGAVYMLRWFWWRINAWSEIVAMLASLVFFQLNQAVLRYATKNLEQLSPASWLRQYSEWASPPPMQTLIVAMLTIVSWLVATWLTRPEDEATLIRFYRQVRPGGPGWKPIAARAPDVKVDRNLSSSVMAALLGAAMVYSIIPSIGWLIFGHYTWALAGFVVAGICGTTMAALLNQIGWEKITQ